MKKNREQYIFWIGLSILLILLFPHYLDTKAGAMESGNGWLTKYYAVLAVIVLLGSSGVGYAFFHKWKLEQIFLVTGTFLGILYMVVLPPLSAPDEARHYISAYQLSNQMMGLPSTGDDDKVIIRKEDWFAEDYTSVYDSYLTADGYFATDEEGATGALVLGQVLTQDVYTAIYEGAAKTEEGIALSNHQPVVTTPFAYLMPALGITLARLLGLSTMGLLWMGRFFNLMLFVAGIYVAMKRLPFGKTVLFGVALLPMTLHLAASYSYDVLLIAAMSCFTAICLDLAYLAEKVKVQDILYLAAIMAIAGPCKMVYAVLMGLCLLIPVKKFGNWKWWTLSASCVLGAWVVAMILINASTVTSYATETQNYITWAGEAGYSFSEVLHQPIKMAQLFYQTFLWQAEYYHFTMIGAYLGHVDVILDVPYWLLMFFTIALVMLSFRKPGEQLVLVGGIRIWIWTICLACAGATMFSMLLAWTPISSKVICGVQGRYFLPFLPILLMSLKNDTMVLTKNLDRSILYLMCVANGYVLLRVFSIVCLRV